MKRRRQRRRNGIKLAACGGESSGGVAKAKQRSTSADKA